VGLFNGQKLEQEPREDLTVYTRTLGHDESDGSQEEGRPGATFVRVLLLRGRLQGAVLIGDTDLEGIFEDLILDGLDLSTYGAALPDPNIELDSVFD